MRPAARETTKKGRAQLGQVRAAAREQARGVVGSARAAALGLERDLEAAQGGRDGRAQDARELVELGPAQHREAQVQARNLLERRAHRHQHLRRRPKEGVDCGDVLGVEGGRGAVHRRQRMKGGHRGTAPTPGKGGEEGGARDECERQQRAGAAERQQRVDKVRSLEEMQRGRHAVQTETQRFGDRKVQGLNALNTLGMGERPGVDRWIHGQCRDVVCRRMMEEVLLGARTEDSGGRKC